MPNCVIVDGGLKRTFLDSDHFAAASFNSHTFTGKNVVAGTVVCCIEWGAAVTTITALTIGGASASQLVTVGGVGVNAAIWIASVPSSPTTDIAVTISGNIQRLGVQIYKIDGMSGLTADSTATSTALAPTATLSVPAGGVVIAAAFEINGTSTSTTWTGITEDADASDSVTVYSSASDEFASANASLTATATFNGAPNTSRGAFAVFAP